MMESLKSVGYWNNHTYVRLNVKDYVEDFCGWNPLKELIAYAGSDRNQAFITALFLTGGRVSETLALAKDNFEVRQNEGVIIVRNMKLLKRYKKLSETVDSLGHRRWITERLVKTRKPFPIVAREPYTPILLEWLNKTEGLLFRSPYKTGFPLSRSWAYKFIRNLDKELPEQLKRQLGLDKPVMKDGKKVRDKLHLWLHWFRSQRASQLVTDYGYEVIDLIGYFNWERYDTALRYAKKGWRGLASKMLSAQVTYT